MSERTLLNYITFPTPIGWIAISASTKGICRIDFYGSNAPSQDVITNNLQELFPFFELDSEAHQAMLDNTNAAICKYFFEQTPLPAIPLDIRSGTAFQKDVWQSLCQIPFGETKSYSGIARNVGKPEAARAVGQACGKNPIPLIIPCHRVISQNGRLGGFSSGLGIKKALLKLENARFSP